MHTPFLVVTELPNLTCNTYGKRACFYWSAKPPPQGGGTLARSRFLGGLRDGTGSPGHGSAGHRVSNLGPGRVGSGSVLVATLPG